MAVIVKYVVVRNGIEKMTFATKKEADAHDKMLDIAENLYQFFKTQEMEFSEEQMDELSLCLAKNKNLLLQLLRGGKKVPQPSKTTIAKKSEAPAPLKKAVKKAVKKDAEKINAASKSNEDTGEKKKKTNAGKKKKTA